MILRLIFLFLIIIPFFFFALIPQLILVKLGLPGWQIIPRLFHKLLCRMFRLNITVTGRPDFNRPMLIVSNHISWIDIAAIGSQFPISIIAKSEVSGWPVIGLLASLHKTIFVNRRKRIDSGRASTIIGDRLASGDSIVLFAEGTSGDGTCVLPFRSALLGGVFRALEQETGREIVIQPMAICYTHINNMVIARNQRCRVAWVGDAELAPHALQVMRGGSINMQILFGAPIYVHSSDDRKEIARRAHEDVRQMLLKLNNHPE